MTYRPNALVPFEPAPSESDGEATYRPEPGGMVGEPPELVRSAVGRAGKLAARHLVSTLDSPDFAKLSSKERRAWIAAALDRAYGAPPRATARATRDGRGASAGQLADTLARLAGQVRLPELDD